MRDINLDHPIVVGLSGPPGVGKTVTADGLVPYGKIGGQDPDLDALTINWNSHLFYAMPMYEILNIRRSVEGESARDRIRYEIHRVLSEVWPSPLYGAPPYDVFIDIVEQMATHPCPLEGKARDYLQFIGTDLVRKWDEDAWVNWMQRKVHAVKSEYLSEYGDDYEDIVQGVVISDCRFENELELISRQPNGILVYLTASPETLAERQYNRDGTVMTEEQKNHASEQLMNNVDSDTFDLVVETDEMTVKEQVQAVKDSISELTGFNNHV